MMASRSPSRIWSCGSRLKRASSTAACLQRDRSPSDAPRTIGDPRHEQMTSTDTTIAAPDRSPPAEPVTTSTPSLKARALHGSMWTAFNFASSQGLRLGSNLILTRLLVPEAFGTVLLINVVIQGLHMFSDTGIGPSIIRNKRGDDAAFLNTDWTIQVFRGCALWLVCLLLAWPLAMFYEDALLMWLLPVAGLTPLAVGFVSTGPCTFHRHLRLG